MKANELMLGDLLKPKNVDSYFKVGLIGADSIWNDTDTAEWDLDEIEPIPLTPEILEKNGFSADYCNDDLCFAQSYGGDVIGIHINGKNGCMDEMYFKYVHELQHALLLCGIDKEITI